MNPFKNTVIIKPGELENILYSTISSNIVGTREWLKYPIENIMSRMQSAVVDQGDGDVIANSLFFIMRDVIQSCLDHGIEGENILFITDELNEKLEKYREEK